jgi:hypothetical protein
MLTRQDYFAIGPLVEVLDVPGIDDCIDYTEVFSFIEKNIDFLLPIIIFPLTGSVLNTI